jgi:hypothetical protein
MRIFLDECLFLLRLACFWVTENFRDSDIRIFSANVGKGSIGSGSRSKNFQILRPLPAVTKGSILEALINLSRSSGLKSSFPPSFIYGIRRRCIQL